MDARLVPWRRVVPSFHIRADVGSADIPRVGKLPRDRMLTQALRAHDLTLRGVTLAVFNARELSLSHDGVPLEIG